MNLMWTKNLKTPEEKQRFENSVIGSRLVLERLTQILDEEEENIAQSEMNVDTYSTSDWAAKQAHYNGQRSMLRKIKKIINLDHER